MFMLKQASSSEEENHKHNEYSFKVDQERSLQVSSMFESGNIRFLKRINELYYTFQPVPDVQNIPSKKSWFHFKMKCHKGIKIRLIIENVTIFENIFQQKYEYHPFYKIGEEGKWSQLSQSFLTFRDDVVLVIDFNFKDDNWVYICMTIPYTYSDHLSYLKIIGDQVHPNIAYTDQILTLTPEKREVHLVTITEHSKGQYVSNSCKKPIILMTSRVHPGQVSSSFCIQGIISFLMDYSNLQAYLLRNLFIFKIVPMVNPDGVVDGNYRMDTQGFNLNRLYRQPSKQMHPAIFEIAEIMKKVSQENKLQFYFDFHSHSSYKRSFIYGNALEDIMNQTYSELFCKLLEVNYPSFKYYLSNFDERHMKYKDKGESMSKQGCGRVVVKNYGVIQSYTVQSSIFPSSYQAKHPKSQPNNKDFTYKTKQNTLFQLNECQSDKKDGENIIISQNKRLGTSILVTILDMVKKNPFTRINQDLQHQICSQMSAKMLQNEDRFKLLDQRAYQKAKNINQLIRFNIQDKIDRHWNYCGVATHINSINWPKEIKRIVIFKAELQKSITKNRKTLRMKTQGYKKVEKEDSNSKQSLNILMDKLQNQYDSNKSIFKSIQKKPLFPQIKYSVQLQSTKERIKTIQNNQQLKQFIRSHEKMQIGQIEFSINNMLQRQKTQKTIKNSLQSKQLIKSYERIQSREIEISINNLLERQKTEKNITVNNIQSEINKINKIKSIIKGKNNSLNKIITNKLLLQKQKNKMTEFQESSRKRIITECREERDIDFLIQNSNSITKDKPYIQQEHDLSKINDLRYDAIQKKLLPNKIFELKKSSNLKLKLPEVKSINLLISNKIIINHTNKQQQATHGAQ